MGDAKLADVTVFIHHRTARAVRVSDSGDAEEAVWLPLSLIEIDPIPRTNTAVVTLPEWLAKERGLI